MVTTPMSTKHNKMQSWLKLDLVASLQCLYFQLLYVVSFYVVTLPTKTRYSHNNWSHWRKKLILVDGDLVESERSVTCGLEKCIRPKTAENVNKSMDSK